MKHGIIHFYKKLVVCTVFAGMVGLAGYVKAAAPDVKKGPMHKGGVAGEAQDRIIVKFKLKANQAAQDAVMARHHLNKGKEIKQIGAHIVSISADDTPQEVVDRIKANEKEAVEYAEPDALVEPSYIPNDPYWNSEWHMKNINAATAWDSTKGSGIIVAILDTGTDCTHPDLAANCVPGWNVVSNNSDSSDVQGHGTMTAGTVAAIGDNGAGVVGVAYQAKVMPIRITNDTAGYAYWSDITNGILYAADHGARVASNSYASSGSSSIQSAARYLRNKGGIFVASAGNTGAVDTTSNAADVITVSATDSADARTSWSTFGPVVDVSAPGLGIYTTLRGGSYGAVSGTSFSCPITAATIALEFTANPALTAAQAESILFSTVKDIGDPGWDQYYGWGRVDSAAAVLAAVSTSGTRDTMAPSAPTNLRGNSPDSSRINIAWDTAVDNVGVAGYQVFRNGVLIASTSAAVLGYTDTAVAGGMAYDYSVKAFDGAGNVSASSNSATVTASTLVIVTIFSYAVTSKSALSAAVAVSTNVPSYAEVYYGTSSGSLTSMATDAVLSANHNIVMSGLKASTKYFYQVRVRNSDGTSSANTPVSNFRTLRK